MPPTLELDGRHPITIESAIEEEKDVINWASYGPATDKLYKGLWEQRESIEALVKHHLALGKRDRCSVLPPSAWIRGSFNVCVFVEVNSNHPYSKVIFRCPMPHKLAEARYPGSIDEKLGCEVGASIWVEENCPEIRSPHLFGFGFSDGRHFTHATRMPFLSRIIRLFWHSAYKLSRLPLLSRYVWNPPSHQVRTAYMVLEYLGPETGRMLSDSFDAQRDDEAQRRRLFRGLSRILISLARIPQAEIGSFQFHNNGTVTLTNRPLSCSMMILENDGAEKTIQRDTTYNCADAFASDTITFHDHRFLSQPNAVYSEDDCRGQMAVKTLLRVLSHLYIKPELRNGPFLLQLTDFHASNVLVDEHWNVTGLIDLEWICALPSEMLECPYWLSGCAIDQIKGEKLERFDRVRREFMRIFEEEEQATKAKMRHDITLSKVMQDMWESKGVWFWHCLSSVNAMYYLVQTHLCPPKSLSVEAEECLSRFWCGDSEAVVRKKMADKQAYDDQVRKLFSE
ncbi:Aminoglycoside phosphotransferase [Metarhizium album ARSEF 1941]|uniref:Aminoglycoside phosphotransferase n=1 Tax=Metarhizium album (strain ARSEF 1941) TaxID=1081103 RepID=A0A0B2WSF5_METAS|nr:Aminoglycoside phosphotransferase [Metarhizium album ARSEF 1941]KHN96559.1 Aminoglycoside phosphotransferase [Metarhizium album ARSEF 1941]